MKVNQSQQIPGRLTLFVSNFVGTVPKGGREMLSKMNLEALSMICPDCLKVCELARSRDKVTSLTLILRAFRGHMDGLTEQNVSEVLKIIQFDGVRQVFVDGSNLGGLVAILKRSFPAVEVITFFHNVEARFFWGSFKSVRTLRSLGVLMANYLAERKAAMLSDKLICLSTRDSIVLRAIYGRGATHISPLALEDKLPARPIVNQFREVEPYALFVGGNFYANRIGIEWFAKKVAPWSVLKVCVVGFGMDEIRAKIQVPGKLEVIGPVDNLYAWYQDAQFVIAPIFDGSGMKTKVAEALMFGKKIVGTPEAFAGYEDIVDIAGWSCKNAEEFLAGMQVAQRTINLAFDPFLRDLYERKYSFPAATARLAQVLSA